MGCRGESSGKRGDKVLPLRERRRLRRVLRRGETQGAAGAARPVEWSKRHRCRRPCFTVWANVYDRGRLAPRRDAFLVQGGTSGIGSRRSRWRRERQPRFRQLRQR